MRVFVILSIALLSISFLPMSAATEDGGLRTLRGAPANAPDAASPLVKMKRDGAPLPRNYKQQPPLIPHAINNYQLDYRVNRCLGCHDPSTHENFGAPQIGASHFYDRNGNHLDKVAPRRYFCTQCHVPQMDAAPLVDNGFKPASSWDKVVGGKL